MLVNTAKTKVMKFNRASSMDFPLEVCFNNKQILEEVNVYKLLGVMVSSNLKWNENTDYICTKARKKIWLLRNMKRSGLTQCELIDAYKKEVRSLLELAVPVWHSSLTKEQSNQIERVQKLSLAAILGNEYAGYVSSLKMCGLESLHDRRIQICSNFITKNMKSACPMLSVINKQYNTRSSENLAEEFQCRTQAFFSSSLPYLARLYDEKLNEHGK